MVHILGPGDQLCNNECIGQVLVDGSQVSIGVLGSIILLTSDRWQEIYGLLSTDAAQSVDGERTHFVLSAVCFGVFPGTRYLHVHIAPGMWPIYVQFAQKLIFWARRARPPL